jgi:hypothetical protein
VDVSRFSEREMRDRREAAAKLAVRREALVKRLAQKSGVMHKPGSMYGICHRDINGVHPMALLAFHGLFLRLFVSENHILE